MNVYRIMASMHEINSYFVMSSLLQTRAGEF